MALGSERASGAPVLRGPWRECQSVDYANDVIRILTAVDINISTNDGGAEWYKNPIVIGGGVIMLFLLAALASRGSGTTIVKS